MCTTRARPVHGLKDGSLVASRVWATAAVQFSEFRTAVVVVLYSTAADYVARGKGGTSKQVQRLLSWLSSNFRGFMKDFDSMQQ